jgi:sn-glycerol 3-phosphate transport system ATP-binding protein/multiple sugar transport system ATP-binding protein
VLGIRPEQLEVCAPGEALFTLQTEMREMLGADTLVHGLFGNEMLVARLSATEHPAPGQALPLRALPGCLHWFDAASGARLESA